MKILYPLFLLAISPLFINNARGEDRVPEQRDFSQFEETSEYEGVPGATSTLRRWWIYKHSESHSLVPCPEGLDERREAILDAIWNNDEAAFVELVKSPVTGKGELTNQRFAEIVRGLQKMDRWPLRTMRSHPTLFTDSEPAVNITAFHQLMTLPATDRKPRRGNLNLIFRKDDWSLAFVRVNWFDDARVNLLPPPHASIENDPVVDRGVPAEGKDSYGSE